MSAKKRVLRILRKDEAKGAMRGFRSAVIAVAFLFCTASFAQEKGTEKAEYPQKREPSIVTIEQALKTSYTKNEKQNTEVVSFSGNVIISVAAAEKKTIIHADLITYNRSRNVLYASGNVTMEQFEAGKQTKALQAESVLFNTVTLEGIFYEGKVVHQQQESVKLPQGAKLIVSSDVFAKDRSDVVTFKNADLTFCDSENPHWKIKASRIWLLPGNEFAFANALLYVGSVPLMYFPFFYYPKDELFFNPSFGYRPREGYFVQTTTYFMGRKQLKEGSGGAKGFNFMQSSSLKEQTLSGLVLRNLDADASAPAYFFKFMADYYSTLGGMVGLAGDFKPNNFFRNLAFDVRLGLSNTIYPVPGYTQYVSYSKEKQRHNDFGFFFGLKLPFRYAVSFKTSIQKNNFSMSMDLPSFSDPKFARDFSDRKESMDWIDFFLQGAFSGAGKTSDVSASSPASSSSSISSYTWNVSGSYVPSVVLLRPWVESFSLSSFGSSVLFSQQKTPKEEFNNYDDWYINSPNRDFFYPVQIKPLAFSVGASGTLFTWPPKKSDAGSSRTQSREKDENNERIKNIQNRMRMPEILSDSSDTQNDTDTEVREVDTKDSEAKSEDLFGFQTLPDISISKPSGAKKDVLSYKLSYTFRPDFSSLLTYSPKKVTVGGETYSYPEFFLQSPKTSEIALNVPLDINSRLTWYDSLLSVSNTVALQSRYQAHPIISDFYAQAERNRIILSDYSARKINITNTNSVTVKPLIFYPVVKDSSVSWNTGTKLLYSTFTGTIEKPAWAYTGLKWDRHSITNHNLNFTLITRESSFSQILSFQANLPPLADAYTGKAEFIFPAGKASLETGYKKDESFGRTQWYFLPFVQTSSWTFFKQKRDGTNNKNKLDFIQRFEYNIKEKHPERFNAGISWRSMRLSYEMLYGYSYSLDPTSGWTASQNKKFLPYMLSFQSNVSNAEFENKAKTISLKPAFSAVCAWNIVKPTDSYFTFTPSLTFKINKFFNLTFSTESRNKELLRYMQKAIGFQPAIPGERNILLDLLNSFAFWDEQKRSSSGFKLKHINIKLEHDLHDWMLYSEFKVEPRILEAGGKKRYDYKPYFTFSVQWKPMQGVKTVIRDEYGDFILNPVK
ncbi:LPS-assembly protein LptD [Treponema sp. OMZ 840]|uniref:hypothetical protein n=1 Tax=Treponema sp. OMZ 840 TaxID=244313 RepID=UPI003D900BDF